MQFDMHYYGTYAMAAAAGIPADDARTIATSAQFVDDQNATKWAIAKSGQAVLGVATAHHPLESGFRTLFRSNEGNDTRLVWVPFHFLPGVKGSSFREQMVCQLDSAVANRMLDFYLSAPTLEAHRPHALHLMGIAAHVYADTFSHYGFSGLSDTLNQVQEGSIRLLDQHSTGLLEHLRKQQEAFLQRFTEVANLGHGDVFTYPDRPYLRWAFRYQNGTEVVRDNPATFLAAAKALYGRFVQFATVYYDSNTSPVATWESIELAVKDIISRPGTAEERVSYWTSAMREGRLGSIQPSTDYCPDDWMHEIAQVEASANADSFMESHSYKFLVAADYHRGYVLKRLLPEFGLLVA